LTYTNKTFVRAKSIRKQPIKEYTQETTDRLKMELLQILGDFDE
jgi:hypothetical protein